MKALLQGGLASVKQVNDLESQLNLAGSQLGDQGALSQYGMDGARASPSKAWARSISARATSVVTLRASARRTASVIVIFS